MVTEPPAELCNALTDGIPFAPEERCAIDGKAFISFIRNNRGRISQGINIRNVHFTNVVQFNAFDFGCQLRFTDCIFESLLILTDCHAFFTYFSQCEFRDAVDMRGAQIGGGLRFDDSIFHAPALLRDLQVSGALVFNRCSFNIEINITSSVLFADFDNEFLSLSRIKADALYWEDIRQIPSNMILSLRDAGVGVLRDQPQACQRFVWPNAGLFRGERFNYKYRSMTDYTHLCKFIQSHPTVREKVHALNIMLAWLDREGEEVLARKFAVMRQTLIIESESSLFERLVRSGFVLFSDAGRNIRKAFVSTFILFSLSVLVIGYLEWEQHFAPTDASVTGDFCYTASDNQACKGWIRYRDRWIPDDYARFSTFGFAFDAFIPLIEYGYMERWFATSLLAQFIVSMIQTVGLLSVSTILICVASVTRQH